MSGRFAQSIRTNGPSARALQRWICEATTFLPTPGSPWTRIDVSALASCFARAKTSRILASATATPMLPSSSVVCSAALCTGSASEMAAATKTSQTPIADRVPAHDHPARVLERSSVHLRPVAARSVLADEDGPLADDAGMLTRDAGVVDRDRRVARASEGHLVAVAHLDDAGAVSLVDEEKRAPARAAQPVGELHAERRGSVGRDRLGYCDLGGHRDRRRRGTVTASSLTVSRVMGGCKVTGFGGVAPSQRLPHCGMDTMVRLARPCAPRASRRKTRLGQHTMASRLESASADSVTI